MKIRAGEQLIRPEAVIFDWDGTLADNWGAIGRSLNATFSRFCLPIWSKEEVRARTKASARDAFPQLFGDDWETAMTFFYKRFEEFHVEEVRPLPGAEDLLDALIREDIKIALVSNKNGQYLRAEAAQLGWTKMFRNIVGATDAPHDKPAPDPVHLALKGTGIQAGEKVWFVGDSASDLECAYNTTCVPILVKGGSVTDCELVAWPPRAVVESCANLIDVFMDCGHA